jgi:hypothetical protein
VDYLATKMNTNLDIISSHIDEILPTSHMRLDSESLVIGAVRLSVSPMAHEISINRERFWA